MKGYLLTGCMLIAGTILAQQIEIAVQKGHSGDITAISFNSDATLLASAGTDHLVKIWYVPAGREMASFPGTFLSRVAGLKFVEADDVLEVVYEDGSLERWDVATSSLISTGRADVPVAGRYDSKDGAFRVFVERYYVRRQDLATKKTVFSKVPVDISKAFNALAVSEALNLVLAANEDGGVYAYALRDGKSVALLEEHYASVNAVCFSADSRLFATASSDRSIIIWNSAALEPVRRLAGKSFRYEALRFNHAGTQLAVGDELGYGRVVDLQSSRIGVAVARWHNQKVATIRFTPDDSTIYSGAHDNRLCMYDVYSGEVESRTPYKNYISSGDFFLKVVDAYREPYAWINALDISPSGKALVMGGGWRESAIRRSPQSLVVKQLGSGKATKAYAHPARINDVLFFHDDDFFSAGPGSLVRWKQDAGSGEMYFRRMASLDTLEVERVLRGPGNSVLLQAANVLIHFDPESELILDSIHVPRRVSAVTLNARTGQLVYAMFNELVFTNLARWHDDRVVLPSAHSDRITGVDFNPARAMVATCSWDATVKLWDADSAKLLATIISIGSDDHIIVTPDNYYYGTKNSLQGIGFKYGKTFISPEQYDLRFNRPDIVLARLGYVPQQIVRSFHRAYLKRLQKMGFSEGMLTEEIHLPSLELRAGTVPLNTTSPDLSFLVTAHDSKYSLDRINVYVNNVPVYGLNGISLRDRNVLEASEAISIKLAAGRNRIQVSCMNERGVESLVQTAEITYRPAARKRPDLYLAVISVSQYAQPGMNLKYARKDGQDIVTLFKRSGWYENVYVDTLFDRTAVLENIRRLRNFFQRSDVEDQVIFFVSGHGLLDEQLDFYLATHDIDFRAPAARGLRYEDLEGLLDGIPARNKLLAIDACHSGEIDKSSIRASTLAADLGKNQKGLVTTYTYPADVETDHYRISITTSFELMQEVFANVSRGSGAVVISAAAGNSYALESDEWKNGVFSFALINGLHNRRADGNKDRVITVTELKDFVSKEVERLTRGEQRPTSRHENLEFDFRVW